MERVQKTDRTAPTRNRRASIADRQSLSRAVTAQDLLIVSRQLGREPQPLAAVTRRCSRRCPRVVATWPGVFAEGNPRVFPTLYWLTCPRDARAIGQLEAQGGVRQADERLSGNSRWQAALRRAGERYRTQRAALVPSRFRRSAPALWRALSGQGIGGIRNPEHVKCLHLHYAHFLADRTNPVGRWVSRQLRDQKPEPCQDCRTKAMEGKHQSKRAREK